MSNPCDVTETLATSSRPPKGSAYPPEFRAKAAGLVLDHGLSVSAAAKRVNVCWETLNKWVKRSKLIRSGVEPPSIRKPKPVKPVKWASADLKNITRKKAKVYSASALFPEPPTGGWGTVVQTEYGARRELSGMDQDCTNDRVELMGVIAGLKALEEPHDVTVHTDSEYMTTAYHQSWLRNWQRDGWHSTKGRPIENLDLWEELRELTRKHKVKWVKDPTSDVESNHCNELAVEARRSGVGIDTGWVLA